MLNYKQNHDLQISSVPTPLPWPSLIFFNQIFFFFIIKALEAIEQLDGVYKIDGQRIHVELSKQNLRLIPDLHDNFGKKKKIRVLH